MGLGFQEAEMMGAGKIYRRQAKRIAEQEVVEFDGYAMFQVEVSADQLAGAITVIGNCSAEAANLTAFKLAEEVAADTVEQLYDKLVHVFTAQRVARNAEIKGASSTLWHISNLVLDGDRSTIFEPVSKHHTSVYSTATKFQDLSRLDFSPNRVAVVKKKSEMKTYLNILAQAGNVIEIAASDNIYERLADAA